MELALLGGLMYFGNKYNNKNNNLDEDEDHNVNLMVIKQIKGKKLKI